MIPKYVDVRFYIFKDLLTCNKQEPEIGFVIFKSSNFHYHIICNNT